MRYHRFYTPDQLTLHQTYLLPKEASHHCVQVLRYKVGARLNLFNGDGFDYIASIKTIENKQCIVEIEQQVALANESPLKLHLYQALARGEKMDLIIQKSVELGVKEITPVFTERCNVKLDGKRLLKKQQHWQNIAISACEQSGRGEIPKVNQAIHLKQLSPTENTKLIYLEPTATQSLNSIGSQQTKYHEIGLLIGPEGGFSNSDIQHVNTLNSQAIRLGPRILRTETAGLTCIAILQAQLGDLC
ncbi:16S rRNA (uracil(1498)-N(3))-methyltransferase [Aliikangiella sp. IMCC44359]|uniref:16S rRNA (uracil(1498)-N(3))-methyltransferase n=1 Tax=Aliikangiella sp. IMCC44359 TaxID=3459125 RepID=UPI00403AEEC4